MFGGGGFTEVTELKWNPLESWTQRYAEREYNVNKHREERALCNQEERGLEQTLPLQPQKKSTLLTPRFWTSGLQTLRG